MQILIIYLDFLCMQDLNMFEMEHYLDFITEKNKIALTKFRLSSHDLAIEHGRFEHI